MIISTYLHRNLALKSLVGAQLGVDILEGVMVSCWYYFRVGLFKITAKSQSFLLFLAILGTFLTLLGPISEFCQMYECCPVLPYNNKKRFRPFPAKPNDSNWIRSPKSRFLQFFSIFAKCQSQKGAKKKIRKILLLFLAQNRKKKSQKKIKKFLNPLRRSRPFQALISLISLISSISFISLIP